MGLFAQLEPDGMTGFLLSDGCAICGAASGGYILDPDSDDVAPSKLAINGKVEHGQVANTAFNLKLRAD